MQTVICLIKLDSKPSRGAQIILSFLQFTRQITDSLHELYLLVFLYLANIPRSLKLSQDTRRQTKTRHQKTDKDKTPEDRQTKKTRHTRRQTKTRHQKTDKDKTPEDRQRDKNTDRQTKTRH